MYALVLTLFFNTVSSSGVNNFNQTVLTKNETQYFTKEQCEYLQEILIEDFRSKFLVAKKEKGLKQLSLTCTEISPLLKKEGVNENEQPSAIPFKKKVGVEYKFTDV